MTGPCALTVVIFTRNDAEHLRACLARLEECPPSLPFEILVLDNASEDDSAEVVASFEGALPLRRLYEAEETSFSRGNNRGLAEAKGSHVLFLNPDTLPEGPCLDACVRLLEVWPKFGLVSPRLHYPDGSHQPTGWHLPTPARLVAEHAMGASSELPADPGGLTEVGWLMGCFLMGRRAELEELGGFDEEFWFHGTDLELCARMGALGKRVVRIEEHSMVHVGHQSWDAERRRRVHDALSQWLRRDRGLLAGGAVGLVSRAVEVLRS
ncbi:MAG: glycosyltransferase family 2 protein [Myxococcota bacterium]|nr:glycosyltransferase family 2 protein [Myxococcota bacterium]